MATPVTIARALIWFLALCLSSLPAHSAVLILNGSAVYQQLTRDYYLAGLYLPEVSDDPAYIVASSTAKRMQLLVTIDRWSPRKWSAQWQNNIAINNDIAAASPLLQQQLLTFIHCPHDDLLAGDEILIDYQPAGNTRVLLNGDLIIETPGTELFNFLLNTWIGKLPPSREFRQQILSPPEPDTRQTLLTHKVSSERQGLYARWLAGEKAVDERLRRAEEAKARARAEALAAEQLRRQEQQLQARQEAEAKAREAERQRAQNEQKRADEARITAARNEAAKQAAERANILRTAQDAAASAQAKELVGSTSNALGQRKTAAVLAEEQGYFLQLLQWQLQQLTSAGVIYPAETHQSGQHSLAQVDFLFSRERNISDQQVRNEQTPAPLISELERALAAAAQQVEIPAQLAGSQWPLSVAYRFDQPQQDAQAMPVTPASLKTGPLSPAAQETERQQYRELVNKAVAARVEYPATARILQKQDSVSVEVDSQADGSVAGVRQPKPSPHRELNDALRDAVKKAQPFPPLPEGLPDSVLTVVISHEFRL